MLFDGKGAGRLPKSARNRTMEILENNQSKNERTELDGTIARLYARLETVEARSKATNNELIATKRNFNELKRRFNTLKTAYNQQKQLQKNYNRRARNYNQPRKMDRYLKTSDEDDDNYY